MKKFIDKALNSLSFGKITGKKAEINNTDKLTSGVETKNIIEPITGTPFACVKKDENRYVVIFGDHMITSREFISRRQATDWVHKTDWASILNVVGIYINHVLKEQNISTQIKK